MVDIKVEVAKEELEGVNSATLDVSSGHVQRVRMVALDWPNTPEIQLPYNPESFQEQISPQWETPDQAGAEMPASHWKGNRPRAWKIRQVIHGKGEIVENVLGLLALWAERPTDKTQRPTLIRIEWGPNYAVGHIENLTTNRLHFDEQLNTYWGEYDMEFKRNTPEDIG